MKRWSAKVVVLALTAGFGAAGLLQFEASRRADAVVAAWLRDRDVRVAGVAADPFSGRLTLRGLVARADGVTVSVGVLRLPLATAGFGLVTPAEAFPLQSSPETPAPVAPTPPAPPLPAPPAAAPPAAGNGSASAENVTVTIGPTTYRIAKIDLAGTPLSNADLAALLDPKSSDSAETRLRRLTAASVAISEITGTSTVGATKQSWTQKQILLANVVKGKAAFGSTGTARLSISNDKTTSNIDIGAIQMSGVDLGQIAHVLGAVRTDDGEPLMPLFDSIVANAIKVTDVTHDQAFTITVVKEEGIKGRALKTDLRTQGAALANATPNDPATNALIDDLFDSISARLIEFDDIAAEPPKSGNVDDFQNFALAQFAIREFGGGHRLGGMDLRGFRFENRQGKMALATASFGVLSLPRFDAAAAGAVPTLDKFDVTDLSVNFNTAAKGEPEQRLAFGLGGIHYDAPGFTVGQLPPKSNLTIDHGTYTVPPNDPSMQAVRDFGYSRFDVSSRLSNIYASAQQVLSINPFSVSNPGIGTVRLRVDLANVSNGIVSSNQSVQKASALAILFKGADLVVLNEGVIEKALAYKAQQDGKSVDEERSAVIDFVTNQLPSQLGDPPKLKPVSEALAKFLAAPKSFHLGVSTKNGLGVADAGLLNDPLALLDQLDIQAAANE